MPRSNSLSGHLLVAIPALGDPNFFRSVVLILNHDAEGASGLVLTRTSKITVASLWESATGRFCECEQPVRIGGPVQGPVLALHQNRALADDRVLDDLWVSSSIENLTGLLEKPSPDLQIFNGYSGWGPDQLESELETGGWLTCPAQTEDVFGDSEELWRSVCERIGFDIMKGQIGPNDGSDPSLN